MEGVVIASRFRLVRPLEEGGARTVWIANDARTGVEVAVKLIAAGGNDGEAERRAFEKDAATLARLRSPHLVEIVDQGIDDLHGRYLAMELLTGESLQCRVERLGPLDLDDAVRVVTQLCHALSKAHRAGLVHGSIDPTCVQLVTDPATGALVAKLLGFSIAKKVHPPGSLSGKRDGAVVGPYLRTLMYSSPEQALASADVDFRSDLYSLALVAWFCVAGPLPFDTGKKRLTVGELLIAVATKPIPPPSTVVPTLSPDLDEWFRRALDKEPINRFASARRMAEGLVVASHKSGFTFGTTSPSAGALRAADGVQEGGFDSDSHRTDSSPRESVGGRGRGREDGDPPTGGQRTPRRSLRSPIFRGAASRPPAMARRPLVLVVALAAVVIGGGAGLALRVRDGTRAAEAADDPRGGRDLRAVDAPGSPAGPPPRAAPPASAPAPPPSASSAPPRPLPRPASR